MLIIRTIIIDLYVKVPANNNCIHHKANYIDHNSDAVFYTHYRLYNVYIILIIMIWTTWLQRSRFDSTLRNTLFAYPYRWLYVYIIYSNIFNLCPYYHIIVSELLLLYSTLCHVPCKQASDRQKVVITLCCLCHVHC